MVAATALFGQLEPAVDQVLDALRADESQLGATRYRLAAPGEVDLLGPAQLRRVIALRAADREPRLAAQLGVAAEGVDVFAVVATSVHRCSVYPHDLAAGVADRCLKQLAQLVPGLGRRGVAVDLAVPDAPALFTSAEGADHDGQPVVLRVDTGQHHQAAHRAGHQVVHRGALLQLLGADLAAQRVLVGQAAHVVVEDAQLFFVGLRGHPVDHQAGPRAPAYRRGQRFEPAPAGHAGLALRGGQPVGAAAGLGLQLGHAAGAVGVVAHLPGLLGVAQAAGDAVVQRGGRVAVGTLQLLPHQRLRVQAVGAVQVPLALVSAQHLALNFAVAVHRGRAVAVDLCLAAEVAGAGPGDVDQAALPVKRSRVLVGLFELDVADGGRLHRADAVGADQPHGAAREFLAQLGVVGALLVGAADLAAQRAGVGAHGLEARQFPLFGIVECGEHHQQRAGCRADPRADQVLTGDRAAHLVWLHPPAFTPSRAGRHRALDVDQVRRAGVAKRAGLRGVDRQDAVFLGPLVDPDAGVWTHGIGNSADERTAGAQHPGLSRLHRRRRCRPEPCRR